MNELEPRKVVGAGLMAAGFSLIILALFVAVPATSWAQKDNDQRGKPGSGTIAAAPQTPQMVCTPTPMDKLPWDMEEHLNGKCNPAYAITSVAVASRAIFICCVPK